MSASSTNAAAYVAAHKECSGNLPAIGIPAMDVSRQKALDSLLRLGLPTQKDEDWKYTSTKPITKSTFTPTTSASPCSKEFIKSCSISELDPFRLVFSDGFWMPEYSEFSNLPKGVQLIGLGEALRKTPEIVTPKLGTAIGQVPHGFSAMNSAFVGDGVFLKVADEICMERAIEILFISGFSGEGFLSLPRNLVVLGNNSKATVVERHITAEGTRVLTNSITELLISDSSELEYSIAQKGNEKNFHVHGLFANLGYESRLKVSSVISGGSLVRNDVRVNLDNENAEVDLSGLYIVNGKSHVDNHTHILHNAPNCKSRECFKGVLSDRGHAVFHGRISVKKDAQNTNSELSNQNLLLSRNAEIDTKPQLEIYADNVKCAHGATVGQLDETAIFYLMSRGISYDIAQRMLTEAFAESVINEIKPKSLREYLKVEISGQLSRA